MFNSIIRFSLRYRSLVVMLSVAVMFVGGYLATTLPVDVFPDLDRPRVVIITECRGLATEEVETLVTQPIEIAILGASGVQAVRSQTTSGLNVIYVEFDWSTDVRVARQIVGERLATVADRMPEGVRPQMTPTASIMGQVVIAGMYRREGPRGGVLAPLGEGGMVAERVVSPDSEDQLLVWRAAPRDRPEEWTPVDVDRVEWRHSTPGSSATSGAVGDVAEVTLGDRRYAVEFPDTLSQEMSLRTLADWVIRPRLLKIPGIAEVFVQGGERKQYQALVDPTALVEYGVSLQQVEDALEASNINTSGGYALTGETERPIRILGRLGPSPRQVVRDLERIPVRVHPERSVLLGQVARVVEGPEFKRGDGAVNGRPGVVFTIAKQPHVDTRRLTDDIETALREVEAALPADIVINPGLFRLKNFIDRGIFNIGEALVIGAVLVIVVLFLFLLNLRTTFITLTAIPLSLVITALVFRVISYLSGTPVTINVMTLGGIAVAMGELVDDAIVDVENIFRRLKVNNTLAAPRSPLRVVFEASVEIRSAIVYGTAVVILVFLPLFALSGVEGRLFAPLGVAYIVSILASLAVSLTVTPVLSYYLLPQAPATHTRSDGVLLRTLKAAATPMIRLSMRRPALLLIVTWCAVAFSAWLLVQRGRDFLPAFDEGSVLVNVTLPPGSSLEASNNVSRVIDVALREMQRTPQNPAGEVLQFVRRTGRAELDEHAQPVNAGEYIISMNPASKRSREQVLDELLHNLRNDAPGVDIEVEQPLAHLISHMVSGVYAQIAIKIHGDDLDTLRALAERVKRTVGQIDGVTPPVIEPIQQADELHIRLDPDALALYGAPRKYVAEVLQTALQGRVVSEVLEGQRRFDLLVRLEKDYRTDYANLGRLRVDLPGGRGQVELSELAEVGEGVGPNAVNRENARRRIVIRCNTQDRDLASAVAEIERRVGERVDMPEGYFVEYGGQFESQQRATTLIGLLAIVSVVGMFLVLFMLFPSAPVVLQILNAAPTAFIGGVFALVVTGQTLTVASLVGFISLGGIAVRNGILLVTHYFHLMEQEGEEFSPDMILRGSLERLAPVLMTALTAGIGLIPLVVGGQEPGREILYPVATVILGGLATSTFCEFLIHPGLFWRFSGGSASRLVGGSERDDALAD